MPSGKDSPDNASIWNMNEKKHCMKDIFPQTAYACINIIMAINYIK